MVLPLADYRRFTRTNKGTVKHRAANVRMRHLARDVDLVVKTRQKFCVARNFGGQELRRHLLAEPQVRGAVDLAHSTDAQQTDDTIALAEQGPGNEAAFFTGAGRRTARTSARSEAASP